MNAPQNKNWSYFIDRIIEFSQIDQKLPVVSISGRVEADIIFQTKENFKIAKEIYKNMYASVGHNLHDYLKKFTNSGIRKCRWRFKTKWI